MEEGNWQDTRKFKVEQEPTLEEIRQILIAACRAMEEKGYNPISQLVGYLLSGDPAYITSYQNARNIVRRLEREKVLEYLVQNFLAG